MFRSFHFHSPSVTYFLCCIQADDMPPLVSRSGRPIELLPSGPISLIGNKAPTLAAIMHRGVRLKKVTTKRTKTSPSVAATALAQAFKVNFFEFFNLYRFHPYTCCTCTHKLFIVVSVYRYIGKDQKYDCRCPPVQSIEEKRFQEYQITSEAPENSNASSSPKVSDPSRIISFVSRSPDTRSTISSSATRRTPNGRIPARRTSARRNIG